MFVALSIWAKVKVDSTNYGNFLKTFKDGVLHNSLTISRTMFSLRVLLIQFCDIVFSSLTTNIFGGVTLNWLRQKICYPMDYFQQG